MSIKNYDPYADQIESHNNDIEVTQAERAEIMASVKEFLNLRKAGGEKK